MRLALVAVPLSRLATITVSIVLACEPNAPLAHETRLADTRQPRPAQHVTSRTNRRTCARALGSRAVGDGVLSIALRNEKRANI